MTASRRGFALATVLLSGSIAHGGPPRPLSQPDLSPTVANGGSLSLGFQIDKYAKGVFGAAEGWLDWSINRHLKLGGRMSAGPAAFDGDETEAESGWYQGNLTGWARLITGSSRPDAIDLGLGGMLMLPTAAGQGDSLLPAVSGVQLARRPGELDPTYPMIQIDADTRIRRGDRYLQLGVGVLSVLQGGTPQVDMFHIAIGGGTRMNRCWSVVATLHVTAVSDARGGGSFAGLEVGAQHHKGYLVSVYWPMETSRGAMGVVSVGKFVEW